MLGTVYVLYLKDGYYYIGYTRWFNIRMKQHFSGNGARFTRLHKPLKVLEIIDNVHKYTEHLVTRRYIKKYGASKVRGGDWVGCTKNSYCPIKYLR
jgi:predicted GIY-YIG superfamily endonuclease